MSGAEPIVASAIAPELLGATAAGTGLTLGGAGAGLSPALAGAGMFGASTPAALGLAAPTSALLSPGMAAAAGGAMALPEGVASLVPMNPEMGAPSLAKSLISPEKMIETGVKGLLSEQKKQQGQGMQMPMAMPMMQPRGPYQSISGTRPISQFLARR